MSAELLNPAEFREKVLRLEAAMKAMHERQVEIKTTHTFAPGLYMREIFVPKGTMLVGKIQKTEYLNIISQGDISVMTEAGMKRSRAPAVLRSHPGLKRAGIAHEDTIWITVHQNPGNERDIEKLEALLFAETFDEVPAVMETKSEAPIITWQNKRTRSFGETLELLGVTPEQVTAVSENPHDQIAIDSPGIRIADSPIHGKGVFATARFQAGDVIAPARARGLRAPAGRFGNHGEDPNAEMVMRENGDVDLVALREIEPGAEVLSDYYLNYVKTRR